MISNRSYTLSAVIGAAASVAAVACAQSSPQAFTSKHHRFQVVTVGSSLRVETPPDIAPTGEATYVRAFVTPSGIAQ